MKRVVILVVEWIMGTVLISATSCQISEPSPLSTDSLPTYFTLDVGAVFDNYGRLDDSHTRYGTEYAGFRIAPDVCFKGHWGLKLNLGAAWAFTSNVTGSWEKPMHSITNFSIVLAPYHRFTIRRWFIDLGIEAGCRFRLPYMNGVMSRYLMTLSVGVGANFRFGYMVSDHVGLYAGMNAERTVYDLLFATYYSKQKNTAGMIGASAGLVFKF